MCDLLFCVLVCSIVGLRPPVGSSNVVCVCDVMCCLVCRLIVWLFRLRNCVDMLARLFACVFRCSMVVIVWRVVFWLMFVLVTCLFYVLVVRLCARSLARLLVLCNVFVRVLLLVC